MGKHHHDHSHDDHHGHDHDDDHAHHHHDEEHQHHHEHDHDHDHDHSHAPEWVPHWMQHHWMTLTVGGAGLFLLIGFIGETFFSLPASIALGCYLLSCLCGGIDPARDMLPGLLRGKFDTHLLMLAAAAGAGALGKWPEGAFLLFLFSLGHAGEHYALDRARNAVSALGELMPKTARARRDNRIEEVPVEKLVIDDIVVVRAGDRVPVDGKIEAGESNIDQSAITGESVPVHRSPGESVFAGTINRDNALDIRVTRLAKDNTLARVMQLVSQARERKSPGQRFAENFARRFVPVVLGLTLLVIFVPPFALGWSWSESFYRGMLILVAASPCALAIGTPAAVLAGIAQAARHGVLIKGGIHLENLGRLQTIAFDKTGTLTTGKFSVTEIVPLNGFDENDVLRIAAAMEEQSNHPLAAAIVSVAKSRDLALPSASGVENLAGRGLRATVDGEPVTVGALRAFDEVPAEETPRDDVARLEAAGQTTVIVRRADRFIGIIGLADQAREGTGDVMKRLHKLGIERRVMLTGDNTSVARAVADKLGIDEYHAELLPEKKLEVIESLQKKHGSIAMVGDGVNDAPALAAATVGIAMGGAGTAVALETADVALMGDDLAKLPFAVGLSRASRRIIKQNLAIALGVIGLLMLASLAGAIPLSVAVLFHEGSTVAVVLNALRLLAWKEPATT